MDTHMDTRMDQQQMQFKMEEQAVCSVYQMETQYNQPRLLVNDVHIMQKK